MATSKFRPFKIFFMMQNNVTLDVVSYKKNPNNSRCADRKNILAIYRKFIRAKLAFCMRKKSSKGEWEVEMLKITLVRF